MNAASPTASKPSRWYAVARTCHSSADRFPVITPDRASTGAPGTWRSSAVCPGRTRRRASAMATASSASDRAVPTCSRMWLRPSRRSAIWTFVAPERPADFRTNTTDLTLPRPGVRQSDPQHGPDQHKQPPNRQPAINWHESGVLRLQRTQSAHSSNGQVPASYRRLSPTVGEASQRPLRRRRSSPTKRSLMLGMCGRPFFAVMHVIRRCR